MGTSDLQLQISDGTNDYAFDFEGQVEIQAPEMIYKTAAALPELEIVRETWIVRGATVVASTDSVDQFWLDVTSFLGHAFDRTGTPVNKVALVRDPGGTDDEQRALDCSADPPTTENLQIEALGLRANDDLEGPAWLSSLSVDLRITGERVFPDSNGIVSWRQREFHTYPNGRHRLERRTEIRAQEGAATAATALELAKLYAKIDVESESLGTAYAYDPEVNGPDGFSFEYPDVDVPNSYTPKRIICRSVVEQWGESIGEPTPGNSPNGPFVHFRETIREGLTETERTFASAEGPGALNWAKTKRPSTVEAFDYERELEDYMGRSAQAEWRIVRQVQSGSGDNNNDADTLIKWEIELKISGGYKDYDFVTAAGDGDPIELEGLKQPWRLEVEITSRLVGASPKPKDMPFPPALPAPWRLIREESDENPWPKIVKVAKAPDANEWERNASLVYKRATKPTLQSLDNLLKAQRTVESYWL